MHAEKPVCSYPQAALKPLQSVDQGKRRTTILERIAINSIDHSRLAQIIDLYPESWTFHSRVLIQQLTTPATVRISCSWSGTGWKDRNWPMPPSNVTHLPCDAQGVFTMTCPFEGWFRPVPIRPTSIA